MFDFVGMTSELSPSASGRSRGDSPREIGLRERGGRRSRTDEESVRIPDLKNLPGSVYKNLCFGARFDCSMSLIRKYLCLFVFLDLAAHFLIYVQYLKHVEDYSLVDVIGHQIKEYDIETSFIDIILLAIGRFLFLECFYGVALSNSWAGTALTTALTSVFVIVKPFHYDWGNECRGVWLVFLIALSFVSAWLEAFLVDFRLIGIESLAGKYADGKPDTFTRDIPRIGFFKAFVPMTAGLFRSVFLRSHSMTLFHSSNE